MSGFDENNVGQISGILTEMNEHASKKLTDSKQFNTNLIMINDIAEIKEFCDFLSDDNHSKIDKMEAEQKEVSTTIATTKQIIKRLEDYLTTMNILHTVHGISIEIVNSARAQVAANDTPSGGGSKTRHKRTLWSISKKKRRNKKTTQ
jgi:hypothetical protein